MTGPRSALEEKVIGAVREGRAELLDLLGQLVSFDTTAREVGDPPREEEKMQRFLRARLQEIGAKTDLWEPEPTGSGSRFLPANLDFSGRPQLAGHLSGAGGGRSLLLNGHIDVVSPEPRERWSSNPFKAEVREGRVVGRGTADMKGGIATMLFALESLHRLGARLRGDVVYCTVTDEESSGAGGFAAVARGIRADGGICAEPTDFDAWVACRGSLTPTLTIEGRAGHAELRQPHWRAGGAVNAIEKLPLVLDAIRRLREEWRTRADHLHPLLSPGDIVPTIVSGGEWDVTYPSVCRLKCEITYLPGHVDEKGTGQAVEREVQEWIDRAAAADPWLAEHPLRWSWDGDVVPAEMPRDHPLVDVVLQAGAALRRPGAVTGFDSWHDGATFTRHGGTPTLCFGPGETRVAHTIDECVAVDDLVDHCAAIALTAMRWCGV